MDKGKVQLLGELLGVSALAFFAVKKTETHLVLLFGNQIGYFAAFFHGVFLSGMGEPFDLQALAQSFARAVHDGVVVGMADAALFADFIA